MTANQERNREIVRLRLEGLSYGEIGKQVGATRSAVSSVIRNCGMCDPNHPNAKSSRGRAA